MTFSISLLEEEFSHSSPERWSRKLTKINQMKKVSQQRLKILARLAINRCMAGGCCPVLTDWLMMPPCQIDRTPSPETAFPIAYIFVNRFSIIHREVIPINITPYNVSIIFLHLL